MNPFVPHPFISKASCTTHLLAKPVVLHSCTSQFCSSALDSCACLDSGTARVKDVDVAGRAAGPYAPPFEPAPGADGAGQGLGQKAAMAGPCFHVG